MLSRKINSRLFIGRSLLAVASLVLLSGLAKASSAATLYIADYQTPGQVSSDPGIVGGPISNPYILSPAPPAGSRIIDVGADSAAGKIFYSFRFVGPDTRIIGSANLDGTGATTIVSGTDPAQGLAVDTVNQKVYWINVNTNTLWSANYDGSGAAAIDNGLIPGTESLAIDVANNKYYFVGFTSGFIGQGNLDGSGTPNTAFLNTGNGALDGVDLDLVNNKIYWSNGPTQNVGVANLNGTNINNAFVTGTGGANDVEVDPIGGHVYWSNPTLGTIGRSDLAVLGNPAATGVSLSYITGVGAPWGMDIVQDVVEAVPEPSTFILSAFGLAGLGLVAWRKRRIAA